MGDVSAATLIVLALVLAAEFVNGWTDAPNAIATVVSTRVLRPYPAVAMATALNIAGSFSGVAVATVGVAEGGAVGLGVMGVGMGVLVGAGP